MKQVTKQYYMIVKKGEILPHTAKQTPEQSYNIYAQEVSDEWSNPDFDSVLNHILKDKNISCRLCSITTLE